MSNRQGGPVLNLQSSAYIGMYTYSLEMHLLQFSICHYSVYLISFLQGLSFPAYTCFACSQISILFYFMRLSLNHRDIKKQRSPGAAFLSILLFGVKGTGPGIIGQKVIIFDFSLFQMEGQFFLIYRKGCAVSAFQEGSRCKGLCKISFLIGNNLCTFRISCLHQVVSLAAIIIYQGCNGKLGILIACAVTAGTGFYVDGKGGKGQPAFGRFVGKITSALPELPPVMPTSSRCSEERGP